MSDEELEPMADSLKALFDEEKTRTTAPASARERELARLLPLVGGAGGGGEPGGSNPPGGAGSALIKRALPWLTTFALGAAVGGVAVHTFMPPRTLTVEREIEVPAPPPPAPQPAPTAESAAPAVIVAGAVDASAPAPSSARDASLSAERAILDTARTALGRNDGAHALEATERHARQFPSGQMSEEREAIAIQALVKARRNEEATARGERFRKRYPKSVLLVVVDTALEAAN